MTCNYCDKPRRARGMCHAHYRRYMLYGDPTVRPKRRGPKDRPTRLCVAPGCLKPHKSMGYCEAHYCRLRRWLSHGKTKETFAQKLALLLELEA